MDATPHPENLRGKRYIAYARCATKQGSTQSMRRQLRLIREFGDRHKMCCVAESRNPGIDGYTLALRPDLYRLLIRKCDQDDFDVVVMEDFSRFSRAEPTRVERLEALFAACGVQIVYVASWPADGAARPRQLARPRRKLSVGSSGTALLPDPAQRARTR